MLVVLVVLAMTGALFGMRSAMDLVWFVASALLVLWLLGLVFRERSGRHWYRW